MRTAKDEVDFIQHEYSYQNDTCAEVYGTGVISSPAQWVLNATDK